MTSIPIKDDSHWHELRARHVGASESAALFGLSPWATEWQLYMIKAGKLPAPDFSGNKSVMAGQHFEPAIASFASEKYGITLNKVHRYLEANDEPGMGASLDYELVGGGSRIPVEIKWRDFGDGWDFTGDEITQAPAHYLLQCQHQLGCHTADRAWIIAFINGDARRMVVPRNDQIIKAIKHRVGIFWMDVMNNVEPPVDFTLDAGAISDLAALAPLAEITPPHDRFKKLTSYYFRGRALASRIDKACDAAKAELLHAMLEEAKRVGIADEKAKVVSQVDGLRLTATYVDEIPGKEITQEMIGQRIGERSAYRLFRVTKPKGKSK